MAGGPAGARRPTRRAGRSTRLSGSDGRRAAQAANAPGRSGVSSSPGDVAPAGSARRSGSRSSWSRAEISVRPCFMWLSCGTPDRLQSKPRAPGGAAASGRHPTVAGRATSKLRPVTAPHRLGVRRTAYCGRPARFGTLVLRQGTATPPGSGTRTCTRARRGPLPDPARTSARGRRAPFREAPATRCAGVARERPLLECEHGAVRLPQLRPAATLALLHVSAGRTGTTGAARNEVA